MADKVIDAIDENSTEPLQELEHDIYTDIGNAAETVWNWLTEPETYQYSVSCSVCDYVFQTNDYNEYMTK